MKHSLLPGLLALCSIAAVAAPPERDCARPVLVLDARLTPALVDRDWGTGTAHDEAKAAIELRDCAGKTLDRLQLSAPLARLDPQPLRGAPAPTWLVSTDLTAAMGSYSGPLTLLVEASGRRLHLAEAADEHGQRAPIHLAATGKRDWRRVEAGDADDLLSVSCQPDVHDGFVTLWRRYHPGPRGWTLHTRSANAFWESDGGFPPDNAFPAADRP